MINIILATLILILIVAGIVFLICQTKNLKKNCVGYVLIPVSAKTTKLVSLVRAYYLEEILENKKYKRQIILVKMDGSLNSIIANRLAEDYSIVSCVEINKLQDFLKKQGKKTVLDNNGRKN